MNSKTLQFMDKQIMDLSNSKSLNDSIDQLNPQADHLDCDKSEEIDPSYDFQPIRPTETSMLFQSSDMNFDSSNVGGTRAWNSADSNIITNTYPTRSYGSRDPIEPPKVVFEKDREDADAALLSEIDQIIKKHSDGLLCALEGLSARISQLESRTHHVDNSIDNLKVSLGNNYGSTDGKMRQLENILREVQDSVEVIKDKQEIMEAHMQLAKFQVSKGEQQEEGQNTALVDPMQAASAPQQSHQQLASVAPAQAPFTFPPSNVPPALPPQQNLPLPGQLPNQFPQTQAPVAFHHFLPPGQMPDVSNEQYQISPPPPQQFQPSVPVPPHQLQHSHPPPQQLPPSTPAPPQHLQPSSQAPPQHLQPPPQAPPQHLQASPQAPPQHLQPSPTPSQQHYQPSSHSHSQSPPISHHPSLSTASPHQPQSSLGPHTEETPYVSQNYPPGIRQPSTQTSSGASQPQFYGNPSQMYEPPSSRHGSGFSGSYGPSSRSAETYPYNGPPPSQYGGSGSLLKQTKLPSFAMGQSGGSGYPQLPTARILPKALPTASGVGGGSGSGGSGNRVPIDDVIDKVTNMGFSREQVRSTVKKLTESGQSVDLNMVLDKLMNDGEVQPQRGWFGR